MKHLGLLAFLHISFLSWSTTHVVGPTQSFTSPNALYQANVVNDNDTIYIEEADYVGNDVLAVWQADNLVIIGMGDKPHLIADGAYIWGKGIWVLAGDNITVENIEFSGASVPDKNGAGIRLDGNGLTVRHCYFHHNENGILTSNSYQGDILIEHCEFAYSGYGDGFSHNVYIGHVNSLTFRYNYSHHAEVGHNLKSRANENYIYYNRISDEDDGFSSRLIDLSNGGKAIILGNILEQGPEAINNNLIGYGLEGLSNNPNEIYVLNNTLINRRAASCLFVSIKDQTEKAVIQNNIFAGSENVLSGNADLQFNFISDDLEAAQFVDEAQMNYSLTSTSPAIDAGDIFISTDGSIIAPDKEYVHIAGANERPEDGLLDIGAFEFEKPSAVQNLVSGQISVYPNPAHDLMRINGGYQRLDIYDINGRHLKQYFATHQIEIKGLPPGGYWLRIIDENNEVITKRLQKI